MKNKRLNARISPAALTAKARNFHPHWVWLFRELPDGTVFTAINPRSNAYGYWCRKTSWNEAEITFSLDGRDMPKENIISVRDLTSVRVSDQDLWKYVQYCRENG